MALTTAEQEALRFHLGYGNLSRVSLPYTNDGFWTQVELVSETLGTGTETSATTAITAGAVTVVTPLVMTGITSYSQLVVDVGTNAEVVMVQAVTVSTFTALFAKSHSVSGYPISTMCGLARLRMLLWAADSAWLACTDTSVSSSAGLKSVDKGDVVWFEGFQVLRDKISHYLSISNQLSSLTRIQCNWPNPSQRVTRLEAC